jgi:hypothetical protein
VDFRRFGGGDRTFGERRLGRRIADEEARRFPHRAEADAQRAKHYQLLPRRTRCPYMARRRRARNLGSAPQWPDPLGNWERPRFLAERLPSQHYVRQGPHHERFRRWLLTMCGRLSGHECRSGANTSLRQIFFHRMSRRDVSPVLPVVVVLYISYPNTHFDFSSCACITPPSRARNPSMCSDARERG